MITHQNQNGRLVLISCMTLMVMLGSIHAFSVFLVPLEQQFSATRSQVSFTYSLSLACLTTSVLFGHLIYARMRSSIYILSVCLLAASGCLTAYMANNLYQLWFGYSVLFGAANGLGYGFSVHLSAQANPDQKGFAVGAITACYAIGAAISPPIFDLLMKLNGFGGAMLGLGAALLALAPLEYVLLEKSKTRLELSVSNAGNFSPDLRRFILLWLSYGCAVTAGLMVIGHASGIALSNNLNSRFVLLTPIVVAILNMIGSLLGGWLSDKISIRSLLIGLPLLTTFCLVGLGHNSDGLFLLTFLALVGFTYGSIIAIYPVAISTIYGPINGIKVYGRVFTAWGVAGLIAPVMAGTLFETYGNYYEAIVIAAGISSVSSILFSMITVDRQTEPTKL